MKAHPLLLCLLVACGRPGVDAHEAAAPEYARADSAKLARMTTTGQWVSYGRDFTNQRWSPLDQINVSNVKQLVPAWIYRSGVKGASETNPIIVDSVLYFTTAFNHVVALHARTGERIWEYTHNYRTTVDCCGPINRGVSYYDGAVYMGTVDARLVALDADDGHKLWDVSVGDNLLGYHLTGAPTIAEGKVITGVSGGEQGCRCYVDAYDAHTGKRIWRWYTIPAPEDGGWWGSWREHDEWGQSFHRDIAREKADSAHYADSWQHGGAPMWNHPAYDPQSHLLFMNTGNPAPDIDGAVRPGDNLYTNSVVALDARNGKLRWYYQEVPHDVWDYDATTPPMLLDVRDKDGRVVHAVAEAGKNGFLYILERETGKPIRKSEPYVPLLNYMTVPTEQGVIINPGTLGGNDWSPLSYNPNTQFIYLEGNYLPMKFKLKHEEFKPPAQYWGGSVVPAPGEHYGLYSAIDVNTGRIAWQKRAATPLLGGSVATAGGLVFFAGEGKKLIARDARTGEELWGYEAEAGVNASPVSYEVEGTQYIVVAATGIATLNTPRGDALIAFALPKKAPEPKAGRQ